MKNKISKFLANNKISIDISDRDKKLILVFLSVIIVVLSYLLGYQKLSALTQQYTLEASKLHATQRDLIEKTQNRDKYVAETENYKKQYNAVFANYGASVDQDVTVEFLNNVEKITGVWIKGITFAESTNIYKFGEIRSSNPSMTGTKVYTSDLKGWKTALTVSYEASYAGWKQMIDFINNYYSKNAIESISMSYSSDENVVSGVMSLSTYAITGTGRKFTSPVFNLPTGTDNIFYSSIFDSTSIDMKDENGDYILSDYDYYMLLNSSSADVDSCIMGKKGDKTQESILTGNSNAQLDVSLIISGTAGNYKAQYKIGNATYPVNNFDAGVEFEPGNTLDFLIMSTPRMDANDTGYVTLNVDNKSDMTLNIKICNDDPKSSRVRQGLRSGDVVFYK